MVLKSTPGPVAAAYLKVSQHDGKPRMQPMWTTSANWRSAARKLESGIGAALLANDRDAGVEVLSENINAFRKLPFRLRADLTAMVVPELDKRGERILPVKLLADFTSSQVADTTTCSSQNPSSILGSSVLMPTRHSSVSERALVPGAGARRPDAARQTFECA
jgi:hypothetical protein